MNSFKILNPPILIEFSSQLLAVIMLPIILFNLSVDEYVLFSSLMILISLLQPISSWGIGANANEIIPVSDNLKKDISIFVISHLVMQVVSLFLFVIFLFIYQYLFLINLDGKTTLAAILCFIGIHFNQLIIIQAMGLLHEIYRLIILFRIIFFIILVSFIEYLDVSSIFFIYATHHLCIVFLSFYKIYPYLKLKYFNFINKKIIINLLVRSSKTFIIGLINNHFISFLAVFSLLMGNVSHTAIFNLITQLYRSGASISEIVFRMFRISDNYKYQKPWFLNEIFILASMIATIILTYQYGFYLFIELSPTKYHVYWPHIQILLMIVLLNAVFKYLTYCLIPKLHTFHYAQMASLQSYIFLILPIVSMLFIPISNFKYFLFLIILSFIFQNIFLFFKVFIKNSSKKII